MDSFSNYVKKANCLPFWRAISRLDVPETHLGLSVYRKGAVSSKDSIIDRNTRIQSTRSLLLVTVFIALSDKPTRRVETVTWLLATRDKQFTFRLVLTWQREVKGSRRSRACKHAFKSRDTGFRFIWLTELVNFRYGSFDLFNQVISWNKKYKICEQNKWLGNSCRLNYLNF